MAASSPSVEMPRLAVEMHYFEFPRDRWELLLVRACQLGANTVIAPVPWAWHEPYAGMFDFAGATDRRRDLVGFVELCGALGLQLVLQLYTYTSRALPDDHLRDQERCAALTMALLKHEHPAGAIVELQLAEPQTIRKLRASGWHVPIHPIASPSATAAGADDRFEGLTRSLVLAHDHSPLLGRVADSATAVLNADGSLRTAFWRTKMIWTLLRCVGDDFVEVQKPAYTLPDELDLQMAWADTDDVDVALRYSRNHIFLLIENQRAASYSGLLTYRALKGDVLHVHVGLGNRRSGLVLMREDEVVGVAFDGDGSEGGWLTRGLRTSMVFSSGAGCVVPCGDGLIVSAPQSGRFQFRRSEGWEAIAAYRLLLNGTLLPADVITNETHLLLPYVANDAHGATDMYVLLPAHATLPARLQCYLEALQRAHAAVLHRVEALAVEWRLQAALQLAGACFKLETTPATCEAYSTAWREATHARGTLLSEVHALRRAKWDERALGTTSEVDHADFEASVQHLLALADLFA